MFSRGKKVQIAHRGKGELKFLSKDMIVP